MAKLPRLKLGHYYWIEWLNAHNATLFIFCVVFWTSKKFDYTASENLLLTAAHGLTYIFATMYGGRLADKVGYDRLVSFCILGCASTLLLGWIPTWHWTPFVVMVLYTIFVAPIWPALEAAILHCPGKTSMPDRLGIYNIAWAFGDGVGFFVSGVLIVWKPDSILWVAGLIHVFQWVWLHLAPAGTEDISPPAAHRGDHVPRATKEKFMHVAWLANALAFLMLAGFSALTPQVGERLQLPPQSTIWLACTLLFARTFAFFTFWKWEGWHYRSAASQLAIWVAPLALAVAFVSKLPWLVFVALTIFGFAIGLSYASSLYYSLDYGEHKGEHGGIHESILGIGIFIGPLLASVASQWGGRERGTVAAEGTIVGLAIGLSLLGLAWIHGRKKSS